MHANRWLKLSLFSLLFVALPLMAMQQPVRPPLEDAPTLPNDFMPAAPTRLTRFFTLMAPSSIEYCVCTCRWTNSAIAPPVASLPAQGTRQGTGPRRAAASDAAR